MRVKHPDTLLYGHRYRHSFPFPRNRMVCFRLGKLVQAGRAGVRFSPHAEVDQNLPLTWKTSTRSHGPLSIEQTQKARPRMERTAGIHSGTFGIPQADACARWNGPRRPVLICPVGCAQGAAHWWRICGVIPRFVLILAASEKTSVVVFRQATMRTI